jgi:hypothetical protein
MFNIDVEWLDERKSRARFALPGRHEWSAQHVDDLIRVLAEIRAEMCALPEQAPASGASAAEGRASARSSA